MRQSAKKYELTINPGSSNYNCVLVLNSKQKLHIYKLICDFFFFHCTCVEGATSTGIRCNFNKWAIDNNKQRLHDYTTASYQRTELICINFLVSSTYGWVSLLLLVRHNYCCIWKNHLCTSPNAIQY